MWWVFGGLAAILYVFLIITLGLTTLRKGHWIMFILGFFLPLLWIVGALLPPTASAAEAAQRTDAAPPSRELRW
jgi:hypothetical protein